MIAPETETRAVQVDPRRLQADWDSEGLIGRIRCLRAAAQAQGEPGLLAGTAVAFCPFILATLLIVAFTHA